jgi:hypothetical protein
MGDQLLPLPLTDRIFRPKVYGRRHGWTASCRSRRRSLVAIPNFTRFIPPERPDQMPGMWRRYYTRWRVATRECLNLRLLG